MRPRLKLKVCTGYEIEVFRRRFPLLQQTNPRNFLALQPATVEVEVNERAAAVAVVVSGGAGQSGLGASTRVAVSSSASSSTIADLGDEKRANDYVATAFDRETGLFATFLKGDPAEAEAEAEAEASVDGGNPVANVAGNLEETSARGESTATATVLLGGTINGATGEVDGITNIAESTRSRGVVYARPDNGDRTFTGLFGNFEAEVESEVEVEVRFGKSFFFFMFAKIHPFY